MPLWLAILIFFIGFALTIFLGFYLGHLLEPFFSHIIDILKGGKK